MEVQYFINSLRHRPERAYGLVGSMDGHGFPLDNVHIVWGEYWEDYDSFESVCDAAIAEFPEMEGIRNETRPGLVAAMWSFFKVLREIEDQKIENAMVFEDDFVFKESYRNIRELQYQLPDDYRIAIFQYGARGAIDPNRTESIHPLVPVNKYWGRGVLNGLTSHNVANMYTPRGAAIVRERAAGDEKLNTIEHLIGHLNNEGRAGIYSLLSPSVGNVSQMQGESDALPGTAMEDDKRVGTAQRLRSGYQFKGGAQ